MCCRVCLLDTLKETIATVKKKIMKQGRAKHFMHSLTKEDNKIESLAVSQRKSKHLLSAIL